MDFLQSGGFMVSQNVKKVKQRTLQIWGRYDEILSSKVYPARFAAELPNLDSTYWVEDCGHVPHLEKPEETAAAIVQFVNKK